MMGCCVTLLEQTTDIEKHGQLESEEKSVAKKYLYMSHISKETPGSLMILANTDLNILYTNADTS